MNTTASRYHYSFDPDDDSTAAKVCRLIANNLPATNRRVLELGCAAGAMSAVLRHHYGCDVTGFEYDETAAQAARAHCNSVITGSLDTPDWPHQLPETARSGEAPFGAVLAADVLEHLRNPGQCLRALHSLLPAGGTLVVSVPNIAHSGVLASLLNGEFNYQDVGLLDRTHCHFFTALSLRRLLEQNGFRVIETLSSDAGAWHPEFKAYWNTLPPVLRDWLEANPAGRAYQVILRAERVADAMQTGTVQTDTLPTGTENETDTENAPDTDTDTEPDTAQSTWLTALDQKAQTQCRRIETLEQQLQSARQAHETLTHTHNQLQAEISQARADHQAALNAAHAHFSAQLHNAQANLKTELETSRAALQAELAGLQGSLSWRITAPLRRLKRLLGG